MSGKQYPGKTLPTDRDPDTPAAVSESVIAAGQAVEAFSSELLPSTSDQESGVRIQQLYWKQLVQLKVECEYVRQYQTTYRWWVTRIDVAKAVLSVGALGGWAVTHVPAGVWGAIIVLVQVGDATQKSLPISKQYQSLSELVIVLDTLFITVISEWEEIQAGRVNEAAVGVARQNLMRQMHDTQAKHFPTGLHRRDDLFRLAEADAAAYIKATFGTEP